MKVLSIGDVHGNLNWKNHDFDDFDKIIFVGDYTDHWTRPNVQILHNLKEIIEFKKNAMDDVVLLWGNHDLHYLMPLSAMEYRCSGFRPEAYWDLHDLFVQNEELFQCAYQIKHYLWTHAGLSQKWFLQQLRPHLEDSVIVDMWEKIPMAEHLNSLFNDKVPEIFTIGKPRGGYEAGGPLWADISELFREGILEDYHQICGHNRVDFVKQRILDSDTSITFIDCLEKDKTYTLNI